MTDHTFKEWPKMVAGRVASDAKEARSYLSHTPECTVHAQVWSPRAEKFVARHPDVEAKCLCGGVAPSTEALEAAGLSPFNGADPAKFDHDKNGRPGGAKAARKPKKKSA